LWFKSSDPAQNDKKAGAALYLAWVALFLGLLSLAGIGGMPMNPFVFYPIVMVWFGTVVYFQETIICEGRKKHNLRANLKYYRQHKRKIAVYKYLFFAFCFGFFRLCYHLLVQHYR
jgi:hypothetical protein